MASIVQAVRPTRLSLDSSETLRDEFNAQFLSNTRRAININSQSTEAGNPFDQGGNAGKGTPIQSTVLLCDITLPAGDNICIGAYESVKTNEIYYEVWNSLDNHSLWVYGTQDLTCRKVYEGECLNFQFPPEHHIPEHRSALFVVYDQEDGEKTIRNKFYVFTDGYNWQFFIDVESSIATDSYNPVTFPYFETYYPHCDPCEFIQLGVRPPQDCPKVLPFDDDTNLQYYQPEPENNNLKEKVWYFAYYYIDVWGRHSVISPYSTAVFLDGGDCTVNAEDIKCFRLVLNAGSAIVDKIVVLFSNNGLDWFQYEVIDKWDECVSPPDANFWERTLALRNYFEPYEGSPPESPAPDCPEEGAFITTTYTYDLSSSPPIDLDFAHVTIIINGITYEFDLSSSGSIHEIIEQINALGFDNFASYVTDVITTSSVDNVYGLITIEGSPLPDIEAEPEIDENVTEIGVSNTFIYQFCGNKQCIPIAATEVDRYFDDFPIASVGQAIVDDRIAYGDNLVGYDNFLCPIENVNITVVQDEALCETDIVTIIIDAVIQNPYTETNEPVYKIGDAVAFGGLGDLTVGGIDYETEVISIYQQQINNPHQNFIGRLRGTNFIAYGQQYKIGDDSPITIPAPTSDIQRRNMMSGAYEGNFYYQRFTFRVPKGNYIFQIDSHLADGVVDSQYTSTYFWGTVAKSAYNPDGSNTIDDSIREVRLTACEDFTYDNYVVIADLTKPKAAVSLEGDAKAFNGYLRESDTDPLTSTGHDPIELALVEITECNAFTKSITMWTPQTDHNGFYFGTDGGSDYCVNITILDSNCNQVSPTGAINQIGVNSKTLIVQNVIQTEPTDYQSCAYEMIEGTVTDCDGNPISGVSVVLSYTGRYGITDANGEYRIRAHDSAYWDSVFGQDRKTRNVDNLFIAPIGACLYNDCDPSPPPCDTCIDLIHVDWTKGCFGSVGCSPATDTYDFTLDIISGALTGVKTGGTYAVSLIGYDYLDRNNSAQRIGFFQVPTIQSNGVFAPYHFNWSFTGLLDLPSWVKKLRFAVRGNDNQFLLSWVTNKIEFIDSIGDITGAGIATNIRVYIDGLNDFNDENPEGTNTTYGWVKGDRIRFITNGDGEVFDTITNNGLIDLPVTAFVDGHILLIPFDSRLTDLTAGATFELYRVPICEKEAVYWEQCYAIPVLFNEETGTYEPTVTSGTIPFFDTYWFFRAIPQTNQFGLPSLFISPHRYEHHSPSDFWGDHLFAIGRGFVRNENARQTWRLDEIQWSDSLLEDGVINGLGTWRTINKKDYGIQDFGGIVAMKAQRHFLWVLCENDWFAVNIAVNLLQITVEGNVIANPDFFGAAQQKVGFVFGCDLRDTNTVLFKKEWIAWVDTRHTAVCLSDYHNVEDISLLDVKSYWMKKLQLIASLRDENQFTDAFMFLHSGYDPKTTELIITSFGRSEGGDTPVEAQVEITTDNEQPIVEDLWSFSAEDLSISKVNVYIDMYAEPQNSRLAALLPKNIAYPGGSQNQYVIYPPTLIAADNGYDGVYQLWIPETFCSSLGQAYDATKIGGNVNCMTFPTSFLKVVIDMADQNNAGVILFYNAAYGNITDFLFWINYIKVTRGIPVRKVILGRENFNPNTYRNGYNWFGKLDSPPTPPDLDVGGTNYRIAMQSVINSIKALHPEIETSFDSAPIIDEDGANSKFGKKWNAQVNGIDSEMPASYLMDGDFITLSSFVSWEIWRDEVINAVEKLFTERLDFWHLYYSDYDFLAITAWGTSGGLEKLDYVPSMLSNMYVAHYHIKMIQYNRDNNDYINFAMYYRLVELKLDDVETNIEYDTMLLLSNIYKYANPKIVDITTQFDNVYQLAIKTDTNYIIIFINYYDAEIPITSISIDGDNSEIVSCKSQYATSLSDEEPTYETLSNPTIKPFSITMVEVEPYVGEEGGQGIISYVNTLKDWDITKNETISFNVPGKFWSGSYGFTPECYACYENARNPNQLISFVQGRAWMHHDQNPVSIVPYMNFYGTQCEPVIKFVFNGGEQDSIIQKRWLAVRIECKQSLWYSDEIQTQPDQLSAIPIEAFEMIENYSTGEVLCDINTINPNGLSALIDGDSLFGSWIKVRFLINPENIGEYFELDLFLISAAQSY